VLKGVLKELKEEGWVSSENIDELDVLSKVEVMGYIENV
jgi:hypothetical protein